MNRRGFLGMFAAAPLAAVTAVVASEGARDAPAVQTVTLKMDTTEFKRKLDEIRAQTIRDVVAQIERNPDFIA